MSNPYRYPQVGHLFRKCVVCGRVFRIYKSDLKWGACMFCTRKCHRVSRSLFRRMLADGRLEPLLKEAIAELQKEAALQIGRAA
jgi:ferredoxin